MRIAIAGAGCFAKHFAQEFTNFGHEVVVITRSHKQWFDGVPGVVEQRLTDYSSVDELATYLSDCDALISAIYDYTPSYPDVHLALLEACQKSPKCKRFIPSEFFADYKKTPDFANPFIFPVLETLRAQSDVEWTVLAIGWLADYIVPSKNRFHVDIGTLHPLDHNTNTMTIPGEGNTPITMVAARDVAKAVAYIMASETKWRSIIHIQGDIISWLDMAELVKKSGVIPDLTVQFEDLAPLQKAFSTFEPSALDERIEALIKLFGPLGAATFDAAEVEKDCLDYYPEFKLRKVSELTAAVIADPEVIV